MRLEQKASQQIRNVKAAFKRILLLAERVKNMNGNIELAISIVFTLFTGGLMMLVYRFCHDALTYNRRFNIALLMLAFVSTILLTLIQDNPMLSLGVLGSLSICRIRTNTKDPRDLGFVFWALSIGISSAVGAFAVSFVSSLLLGTVLLIFNHSFERKKSRMVIVRGEKQTLEPVQEMLGQAQGSSCRVKMYLQIPLSWYIRCG